MSTTGYWILRCEHQLLTVAHDESGQIFPSGEASAFGNPENVIPSASSPGVPATPPTWRSSRGRRRRGEAAAGDLPARGRCLLCPRRARQSVARLAGQSSLLRALRHPNTMTSGEFAMHCPSCALVAYPGYRPAVMVLVRNGDRLLLAAVRIFRPACSAPWRASSSPAKRSRSAPPARFAKRSASRSPTCATSTASPGPSPFPSWWPLSAEFAGGTLRPDQTEIEAAEWFIGDALPRLPEPVSISRRLIEAALAELRQSRLGDARA